MLRADKRVPQCLVRNVYAYGVGRKPGVRDRDYLAAQTQAFAASGYRVPDLMVQIAATPEFFAVVIPKELQPAAASQPTAGVSR